MKDFQQRKPRSVEHRVFVALVLLGVFALFSDDPFVDVVSGILLLLAAYVGACCVLVEVTTKTAGFVTRQVRKVARPSQSAPEAEVVPAAVPHGDGDEPTPPRSI
jgi:hypothetical protein